MERTVDNLKVMIRAGRAKLPSHKVIKGGQLVNVMSSEVYPADIAIYNDMIVAVGDVSAYIGPETEIIDAIIDPTTNKPKIDTTFVTFSSNPLLVIEEKNFVPDS